MSSANGKTDGRPGRRDVLHGMATATLLAAAALAVPRKAWAIPETKAARERTRYRLTEHIRRFYQTNRY